MRSLLVFSTAILILCACENKTLDLNSIDSRTNTQITVHGEKTGAVEPYKVNITVEGYGMKESVGTEIYSGKLDASNVKFEWRDPGVCVITFDQQDNTQRKILAVALEKKIGIKELGLE